MSSGAALDGPLAGRAGGTLPCSCAECFLDDADVQKLLIATAHPPPCRHLVRTAPGVLPDVSPLQAQLAALAPGIFDAPAQSGWWVELGLRPYLTFVCAASAPLRERAPLQELRRCPHCRRRAGAAHVHARLPAAARHPTALSEQRGGPGPFATHGSSSVCRLAGAGGCCHQARQAATWWEERGRGRPAADRGGGCR